MALFLTQSIVMPCKLVGDDSDGDGVTDYEEMYRQSILTMMNHTGYTLMNIL